MEDTETEKNGRHRNRKKDILLLPEEVPLTVNTVIQRLPNNPLKRP